MVAPRRNVLGLHYQLQPEVGTPTTDAVVIAPVIKGIDIGTWPCEHVSQVFPGAHIFVARCWIGGDKREHGEFMAYGADGARRYFRDLLPRYQKLKDMGVDYVEGPNEPHPSPANVESYDEFWTEQIGLLDTIDMKAAQWSLGVGWAGLARWPADHQAPIGKMARSIKAMQQAGGILVTHEYNAPSVLMENGNDGNSLTLRIIPMLEELGEAGVDVDNLRVVISECGIARAVKAWRDMPAIRSADYPDGSVIAPPRDDYVPYPRSGDYRIEAGAGGWGPMAGNDLGWKSFWAYVYPPQYGLPAGVMTEERYWLQMLYYNLELCKIPQILGATPFGTCVLSEWESFDWGINLIRWTQRWAAGETVSQILGREMPEPELGQPSPEPLPTDWELRLVALEEQAVTATAERDLLTSMLYRQRLDLDGLTNRVYKAGKALQGE